MSSSSDAAPSVCRVLAPKLAASALLGVLAPGAVVAAATCPVIDATTTLSDIARTTAGKPDAQQLAAFHEGVIAKWPGLYRQDVIGLVPGAAIDRQILHSLEAARRDGNWGELQQLLRAQIESTSAAFQVFGDFRCDFPIYMADMLGALDGAGRIVDGRRALILGLDALERERTQISLPVFVTHEFFHRYHFQAAGFSDDLEDRQEIWRNLWAEGLATYVSQVLTANATTADALMLPKDLEQRAQPLLAAMAAQLLAGFDGRDEDLFRIYFTTSTSVERHGIPPRAGYYVGYVVAQRLSARQTLGQLAHLEGAAAERAVRRTLRELADGAGAGAGASFTGPRSGGRD
jgi:hypothetical protein